MMNLKKGLARAVCALALYTQGGYAELPPCTCCVGSRTHGVCDGTTCVEAPGGCTPDRHFTCQDYSSGECINYPDLN